MSITQTTLTDDPLHLLGDRPMAIEPAALDRIRAHLSMGASTPLFSRPSRTNARSDDGKIMILPLFGLIEHRRNILLDLIGGTAIVEFAEQLKEAAQSPGVKAIVILTDSPGGSTEGVSELRSEVKKVARHKPVIAVASNLIASAAYWIVSGSTSIVASPSSLLGSIGVIMTLVDISAAEQKAGVKVTHITGGKYKSEGSMHEPLSEEGRAYLQEFVNTFYAQFKLDVAMGRHISTYQVESDFGQGRILHARDAVMVGMADEVGTFEQVIVGLTKGRTSGFGSRSIEAKRRELQRVSTNTKKRGPSAEMRRRRRTVNALLGKTR